MAQEFRMQKLVKRTRDACHNLHVPDNLAECLSRELPGLEYLR